MVNSGSPKKHRLVPFAKLGKNLIATPVHWNSVPFLPSLPFHFSSRIPSPPSQFLASPRALSLQPFCVIKTITSRRPSTGNAENHPAIVPEAQNGHRAGKQRVSVLGGYQNGESTLAAFRKLKRLPGPLWLGCCRGCCR